MGDKSLSEDERDDQREPHKAMSEDEIIKTRKLFTQ